MNGGAKILNGFKLLLQIISKSLYSYISCVDTYT
jgi:hypothetical protein